MLAAEDRVSRQVGAALRRLRRERGMLNKQVASRANITRSMLSRYERGHQHPTIPNLVKILRALDCSVEEFGYTLEPWGCRLAAGASEPRPPPQCAEAQLPGRQRSRSRAWGLCG